MGRKEFFLKKKEINLPAFADLNAKNSNTGIKSSKDKMDEILGEKTGAAQPNKVKEGVKDKDGDKMDNIIKQAQAIAEDMKKNGEL